ncbi:xyloside xylosyltransferase 1 isoform X4 [Vulpes lagopus]|uniref:xyloside xylosyltransferase 1 isoform X4 n=1 Tax=Vulpes lagopus TaxID=494514 RepID=UPI001BC9010F|nr:xyloside xylosyltransferase 1 isoform X4 [Vulpes lagopus]
MGRRGGPSCARAMARLAAVRSHYCALLLAAALAVCAFYYLGSGRETFSSATKRLKEARAGAPAAPSPPAPEAVRGSAVPAAAAKAKGLEGGGPGPVDYHLLMMFTKAEHSAALQAKARVALRSLLRLAKFEPHEVLNLHFVSEEASREVAKALLRELLPPAAGFKCKVVFHDVGVLTDKLFPVVEAMQKHFSAGSGTYYSDSIFFLSVAMHQIMPKEILRIIQLDLDLKYKTNIRELFEEFDSFLPGAVIGIAREMQPVYRCSRCLVLETRDRAPRGMPGSVGARPEARQEAGDMQQLLPAPRTTDRHLPRTSDSTQPPGPLVLDTEPWQAHAPHAARPRGSALQLAPAARLAGTSACVGAPGADPPLKP